MNGMKPLLLLSNDDGVQAKGLNELIGMLSPLGDILVMAPDGPRSGSACAITSDVPLRYRVLDEKPGLKVCACVRMRTASQCQTEEMCSFTPAKT